jgi:DNA-binding MarR family transcriptional regulator
MNQPSRAIRCRDLHLDLMRLHERLTWSFAPVLQETGVTGHQYNVLRILRGAGEAGLPGSEIAARMVHRVPDITRLVDRLEAAGLVRRERSREDRRVVYVQIEPCGLDLLARFDAPVLERHRTMWEGLEDAELDTLHRLVGRSLELLEESP